MNAAADVRIVNCPNCRAKNRVLNEKQSAGQPVCGQCKTPLTTAINPLIVTDRNFAETIERSTLPVLLDFWAAWCGPCRIISPIVDQLAKELSGKVLIGKLNVDENQQTAARFRVQSIPILLVLKNGREVDRIVGAQSKEAILRRLVSQL